MAGGCWAKRVLEMVFSPGCWNALPNEGTWLEINPRSVYASLLKVYQYYMWYRQAGMLLVSCLSFSDQRTVIWLHWGWLSWHYWQHAFAWWLRSDAYNSCNGDKWQRFQPGNFHTWCLQLRKGWWMLFALWSWVQKLHNHWLRWSQWLWQRVEVWRPDWSM